jgi:hypothetical protein
LKFAIATLFRLAEISVAVKGVFDGVSVVEIKVKVVKE